MKIKALLFTSLFVFSLAGCKNKSTPAEVKEDLTPDFVIETEVADTMGTIEDESCYRIMLNYTDKYFKYTASTFKRDLMMLSFGAAMAADNKELVTKFYEDINFSPIFISPEYEEGETESSIHFVVAKKIIDDFTMYSVAIRGTAYGKEWANNFALGKEGDHVGFTSSANLIFDKLLSLINLDENYKIWISGYSRAGAVGNVLSSFLMKDTSLNINEDNLYTYTFSTPRGLCKENAVQYKNVFNMINNADIITKFAPEEYGLYRCGTDINIYDEKIDSYLSSFSEELSFPAFEVDKKLYSSDVEFTDFVLQGILKEDTETYDPEQYPYDLTSREHYYQVENYVCFMLAKLLGSRRVLRKLTSLISEKSTTELIGIILDDGTKLYNIVKNVFDEYSVAYDDNELMQMCHAFVLIAQRYLNHAQIVTSSNNIIRMINMHMAETVYILISRF